MQVPDEQVEKGGAEWAALAQAAANLEGGVGALVSLHYALRGLIQAA